MSAFQSPLGAPRPRAAGGALTVLRAVLASPFTPGVSDTFVDIGLSLSLTPGAWVLVAGIQVWNAGVLLGAAARLTDGVTVIESGGESAILPRIHLVAPVEVTTTSTWKVQLSVSSTANGANAHTDDGVIGSGPATSLLALQTRVGAA